MTKSNDKIAHLIFDVESVADGDLIARVRYAEDQLTAAEAIERYQAERLEHTGSTFIPHTFQYPVAVVIAKVTSDFRLLDIVSLDEPQHRPDIITEHFWRGWEMYGTPQWVTFNGRSFDIPLMELTAFRAGIPVPLWFDEGGYKSRRNRFNGASHLDLQELLTNFGAAKFNGGLNAAAQMLNKPGKMGLSGDKVQEVYDEGGIQSISDYCRCDVLDTYFVFLRCMVMTGRLSLDDEGSRVAEARAWIESQSDDCQAWQDYLNEWDDWVNPWLGHTTQETAPEPSNPNAELDAATTSDTTAEVP